MGPDIRFRNATFDVKKEKENSYNPGVVWGEAILVWLRDHASKLTDVSDIDEEDHGNFCSATFDGQRYSFVGMCGADEPDVWHLVIERKRTFKEQLLGRGKTTVEDPCFTYVKGLLEADPSFTDIEVDP
ncbi:MAG: hypothetical protein JST51_12265 [Armatimonadetes bacterium]|nr:hypothetical protein [Armatimonadota bacterium]